MLEQRREDQESDFTRGREAFYRLMESDEYSYPKVDRSLIDSIAILKDAGRDDLAAMIEDDRKFIRERQLVRPGEKHRKEREQLVSRIRDLENQVAQLRNRPPDVRVIRDVDTIPVFVDRPVVIDRPVVYPPYCPPTRSPVFQPPSLRSPPLVQPNLPSGGAQIHGAHLYKK